MHVLESIDPARPHAIELLGKQLVLWRDGAGRWQCMQDACPHRCEAFVWLPGVWTVLQCVLVCLGGRGGGSLRRESQVHCVPFH